MDKISIQTEPFDAAVEQQALLARAKSQGDAAGVEEDSAQYQGSGAVLEFTGFVRADKSKAGQSSVDAITLEHYPGMTEKSIEAIIEQARSQWQLHSVTVIHRVGTLDVNAPIIYAAVASSHRKDAFEALSFFMDYLKQDVPIWKKEIFADSQSWVEQKVSDIDAAKRWKP